MAEEKKRAPRVRKSYRADCVGQRVVPSNICSVCAENRDAAKSAEDPLVSCCDCGISAHPTLCLHLPQYIVEKARSYPWRCLNCKNCTRCKYKLNPVRGLLSSQRSSLTSAMVKHKFVFCDGCDRCFHPHCLGESFARTSSDYWLCEYCVGDAQLVQNFAEGTYKSLGRFISYKPPVPRHLVNINGADSSDTAVPTRMRVPDSVTNYQPPQTLIYQPPYITPIPTPPYADISSYSPRDRFFDGRLSLIEADNRSCCPEQVDAELFEECYRKAYDQAEEQKIEQLARYKDECKTKNPPAIRYLRIGDWEINTWYMAPYPEEYCQHVTLYLCQYCLKYMNSSVLALRHKLKCRWRYPPGDEIYREGNRSIFEVDGKKNHKTLYYDVEPFIFYVMTENDEQGCQFVGYFSKEKRSPAGYNLSCIMVLPIHQRKGYGQYLIDFSYLLSKRENKPGSPEKPLSDLGALSYRSYWRAVVLETLMGLEEDQSISIKDISKETSMTSDDIITTLQYQDMLTRIPGKGYMLRLDKDSMRKQLNRQAEKGHPRVQPACLRWMPQAANLLLTSGSGHSSRRTSFEKHITATTITDALDVTSTEEETSPSVLGKRKTSDVDLVTGDIVQETQKDVAKEEEERESDAVDIMQ